MQTSQGASQSPCNGTHCKSEPDCHGHTWQSRNITGLQTSAPRHSSCCCSSAGASSPRNLRGKKLSGWASVPIQAKRWLWPGGFVGGCPCSQGMAVLSLLLVCCSWGTSWQLSLTSVQWKGKATRGKRFPRAAADAERGAVCRRAGAMQTIYSPAARMLQGGR